MARTRWLATLLLLPLLHCQEDTVTAPDIPDDIRALGIRLRVDVAARTVKPIQAPGNPDISFSFVGSDGVGLQTSNLSQTPLGKSKTLVRFDIAITNALTDVSLIKPTVPVPPAGTTGLMLFPFQAKAVTGSGNVIPSSDWDGAPFNFFKDGACSGAGSKDCSRWEQYPAPLAPGSTSAAQTVGFEIDKGVQTFEVIMLVAADLQNVVPAPAAIALSATTADFESSGGSVPASASVVITNSGGGTLGGLTAVITAEAGQPAAALSAVLSSTTAPSLLTLSAFPGVSSDGTYRASVAIASDGVSNSPQTVSVTFIVTGSPVANAIYVSANDPLALDNATCGLMPSIVGGSPCRSITQGLQRAIQMGRPEVRVADGRYTEAVTLVNGKNLLGGYQPDTWQRHLATSNTIIDGVLSTGNHDRTVIASNITSPTVFEGFVVRGAANVKTGGNSYAIYVSGPSANLVIRHNSIYGGTGGPGAQGPPGSSPFSGADGAGRGSDPPAYDAKITTGSGQCDPSNNRSYVNGGIGSVGANNISGGNGGGNACPTSSTLTRQSANNGGAGFAGAPPGGGAAGTPGAGGLDFRLESSGAVCVASASGSHAGGNGSAGGNGLQAAAVSGASVADGAVVGSHWVGAAGTNGIAGGNGGGGGGGGAGGGAFSQSSVEGKDRLGGVGGGGGAGGAGGGGGNAGSAGGGAFAVFILGAAPVVSDNTIVRGTGGTGGGGGSGAAGAEGGQGGAGGLGSVFCTADAGQGGDGGKGGTGSGGGGGSGGGSFAIYTSGAGAPDYCTTANNSIGGGAGGSGGQGGLSQGNPGGAGASGTLATCSFH